MPRLGVAICAAAALLAAEALAQEAPPRYRPACASCPAPALTLEAFVAHTRASSDSNLAQELVTAHTRAERIASVGIFAGVAIAAGGVFLVPMRCEPVLSLHANYSPCDLRRRNLALITAGTTVALMGAAYVALVQPREEELLARVNAWNRVHPDAPFRLPAKPTPRADGPGDAASATDETPKPIHPNDAEIIARRRRSPPLLDAPIYVSMMVGAGCAAAGVWYLLEALEHQRAVAALQAQPLAGRTGPPFDGMPGVTAAACTTLSLISAAVFRLLRTAAPPSAFEVHLGLGGVAVGASFD